MWTKILEWIRDFLNKKIENQKKLENLNRELKDKKNQIREVYKDEIEKIDNIADDGDGGADFWVQHKPIGQSRSDSKD